MAQGEQSERQALYRGTLVRACLACGDEIALARKLGEPLPLVVDWLLGKSEVPAKVFLKGIDIVLGSTQQRVEDSRALLEGIKTRYSK